MRKEILAVLRKLLRPLVRVLLKYQISYGEFTNLVRRTYVEVAYKDFSIPNRKSTYSKVAVMTGLDRKMVHELLNQKDENREQDNVPVNKGLSIVKTWTTDPDYLDENNHPIDLPLKGPLSFESLVKKACADFTSRALLDELIRVGIVKKIDKKNVKLVNTVYIPSKDEQQLANILFTCATDLLVTGEHNINHPRERPWFQREVQYSRIPVDDVEAFQHYSNEKAQLLIDDLNQWLQHKKAEAKGTDKETRRIGLGIYYIETNNDGE